MVQELQIGGTRNETANITHVGREAVAGATRFNWQYAPWLLLIHLTALLAFVPWFFSWTGLVLGIVSYYVFNILGIGVCYHRLLAHRSYRCPLWLERLLSVFGACSVQDSPAYWVAIHRRHHQYADDQHDPHSPKVGLLWSHLGWLLVKKDDMKPATLIARYAKDIMRDPFQAWLERSDNWFKFALATWLTYFAGGFGFALASGSGQADAVQFGLSLLVWGVAVRTVLGWHFAWAVNSLGHRWGYRNYDTPDDSRNNVLIGIFAGGEGWHNNHHADPGSARHGHKRGEFDLAWLTIRLFKQAGLATDVVEPSPALASRSILKASQPPGHDR